MANYLLSDGATTVVTYPYNLGMLRRDNPTVSFPATPSDALLAEWNMFPVADAAVPAYDPLSQDLNEGTPSTSDGGATWYQVWVVTNVDPATAAERYADAEVYANANATRMLQEAEQYYIDAMVAGYGFSADMITYVAALQDPSTLPGYPLVSSWPTLPATQLDPANPDLPVDVYTKAQADDTFIDNAELNKVLAIATGQFNEALALKADITYVDDSMVKGFKEKSIHVEIPAGGSGTTDPALQDAVSQVTSSLWNIYVNSGGYNNTTALTISGKNQLNIVGRDSAGTTSVTIKSPLSVMNSTGVRMSNLQFEGAVSLTTAMGLGQYYRNCQFMSNVTLTSMPAVSGFIVFTDCEFAGNLTVDAMFAGVVYFVRCSFSSASGVYSFAQPSAQQVFITDSTGLPNTQPAKATYAGNIVNKANVQKIYVNNVAINPAGATNNQVLQLVSGTSNEWVPRTLSMFPWVSLATEISAGAKTITPTWNTVKSTYKDIQVAGITAAGHVFAHTINTALIDSNRIVEAHHAAHGSDDEVSVQFGDVTTNQYTLTFTGSIAQAYIYAR